MNALSVIDQMLRNFDNIQKSFQAAKTEIDYRDKEANDLNHALELSRFNAYEGYKLAKQFQENRQARREAKDMVEELEQLNGLMKRYKNLFNELKKVRSDVEVIRHHQKVRTYAPRVRDDLFEKVK